MSFARLSKLAMADRLRVVGLNSGTSMDGIDALLCELGPGPAIVVRHTITVPYPVNLRRRLAAAPKLSLEDTCRLHAEVGEAFAQAVFELLRQADVKPSDIDLIGSHGQTVCHLPEPQAQRRATTLQIGDLDVIAERTGAIVVGDFRARDIAAGGEGAPLMPFLDWLLFRERPRTLCLNLGGIANITLVTTDPEGVMAFDIGPANLPLDLLAARLTNGSENFDPGGRLAATGLVDSILLDKLLAHPFLHQTPPKSTGREMFGQAFVEDLVARHQHLALRDILATCVAFVARGVHQAVQQFLDIPGGPRELVVSGGGVHNLTLMRHLKQLFFPVPVTSLAAHGIDPDAKEALLFACLARERVFGRPGNLPRVTGARWPVTLGKLAF